MINLCNVKFDNASKYWKSCVEMQNTGFAVKWKCLNALQWFGKLEVQPLV